MSSANIDSVQRIYEAFGDGEVVLYRGSEDTALVAERLAS